MKSCPNCKRRFSAWFVWSNALMHCFLCWHESGYRWTFLEDGTRLDTP